MLLHPEDNVYVCCSSIAAGESVIIEGRAVRAVAKIAIGHKVARRRLEIGAQVRKYGVPIGSITAAVSPGDHVHLHNLASDYLPSHLPAVGKFGSSR
jgi:(2R)-sulfolactate sulfo-lyase subunit alpha